MIHEEICTYEVCKLAKEKGFPQHIGNDAYIVENDYDDGYEVGCHYPIQFIPDYLPTITAPTQSLLQRWLREEKGYYVYPFFDNVQLMWDWVCREKTGDKWIPLVGLEFHLFPTYELALEDALKYALENLV